jgi:hypothetical protein
MNRGECRLANQMGGRCWTTMAILGLAAAVACCGSSKGLKLADDGGGDVPAWDARGADHPVVEATQGPDAAGCDPPATWCAWGEVGGECSDALEDAACVGGKWVCRAGTIPERLCGCFDMRPTCHPGTRHGPCSSEIGNPTCGGGMWLCPAGMIESWECGCILSNDGGVAADGGGCP